MRRLTVVTVSIASMVLVSGCSTNPNQENLDSNVEPYVVKLEDGRTVTCVVFQAVQEGGISCDWANAR